MNKKNNTFIALGIVALLAIAVTAVNLFSSPAPLLLQGQVEATQVKVASKLVGRLAELKVREGQSVKAGQSLARIESPEVEAKLAQAMAARKAATAQMNKAENGARNEQIRAAKNQWEKAKAGMAYAEKTYQRVKNLHKEGVIPAQKMDEAEAKWKAMAHTVEMAKSQYDMARRGARSEDKTAAEALVERASGAVTEVESYLEETKVLSPIDGEVASVIPERGELVAAGFPIMTIVDLDDAWVTFNLREDLLPRFKMGSEFDVTLPALGGQSVRVKVNYINALGAFATWKATKSTGDFDMKTFEVRAVPVKKAEGLRPGMTALIDWAQFETDK
ncbi:hemolysin secretion protein D [Fulvitalea axinellae]|uniref:Hemolysin secretion protein D n=1 Tax=Fulvitalea axinellae TaxID=1182444 RepID=A0AAU9CAA2_9BACT|nr:hemolysin secretion protein D [Fulvitalea axinellae]